METFFKSNSVKYSEPKYAVYEIEAVKRRIRRIAQMMDSCWTIPLTSRSIGWDSVLGLIPGVGDGITVAPLAYFLYIGHRYRISKFSMIVMIKNQAWDFLLGLIPLVGDLFDAVNKSNSKNARILLEHLDSLPLSRGKS